MVIDKRTAPKELVRQHFLLLQHKYRAFQFYTDASKTTSAVICAAHGPNFARSETMPKVESMITVETHGLVGAIANSKSP